MELIPNTDGVVWEVTDRKTGEVTERTGWDGWNDISMALYRGCGGSDAGFAIFKEWCAKNTVKYNKNYTEYTWYNRYVSCPPTEIGARTLFAIVDELHLKWEAVWDHEHPQFNDDGDADDDHGDDLDDADEHHTRTAHRNGTFEGRAFQRSSGADRRNRGCGFCGRSCGHRGTRAGARSDAVA
jgi:hypothetical protein